MDLLKAAGLLCEKAKGKNEFYDIIADYELQSVLFEVKYDQMVGRTGNLALEFWNPKLNKPSGIMVTLADFWVFCFGNPLEVWICEVEGLKVFMENNKPSRTIDVGGDKNASLMLYKKDVLLQAFYRIDNIEPTELESCMKFYVGERGRKYIEKGIESQMEQ